MKLGARRGRPLLLILTAILVVSVTGCGQGFSPKAFAASVNQSKRVTWGISGPASWAFMCGKSFANQAWDGTDASKCNGFEGEPGWPDLFSTSGYHATAVREIVDECRPAYSDGNGYHAYCFDTDLKIRRDLNMMHLSALNMQDNDYYVTLACGHDHPWCDTPDKIYGSLHSSLIHLMQTFPHIKYWAPQNEPDINAPTIGMDGAEIAAKMWVKAEKIAENPGDYGIPALGGWHHRVIVAGEFAKPATPNTLSGVGPHKVLSRGYTGQYMTTLKKSAKNNHVKLPSVWSIHAYADSTCGKTTQTKAFVRQVDSVMGRRSVKHIWLTEVGVILHKNVDHDVNTKCTVGHDGFGETGLNWKRQKAAARTIIYGLPKVDSRVDHIYYWTPNPPTSQCWGGGSWDTSLWAPSVVHSQFTGEKRPAYYVLTHKAVPTTGWTASTIRAPVKYISKCSRTSDASGTGVGASVQPGTTVVSQGGLLTGTVHINRGWVSAAERLPIPTWTVNFYLDQPQKFGVGTLIGQSEVLKWDAGGDYSYGSFAIDSSGIPTGTHKIFLDYSDDVYGGIGACLDFGKDGCTVPPDSPPSWTVTIN